MNIIKTLKKQVESGKDIVMKDGNIISKEDVRKAAMKNYLTGVKAGEIPTTKSFDDYFAEANDACVTVKDVIEFIEMGFETVDDENAEDLACCEE